MLSVALAGVSVAALAWWGVLLLPWRPWSVHPFLDAAAPTPHAELSDVTVLIPARNEAAVMAGTLTALVGQGTGLTVIVIDDQSSDGTAAIVQGFGRRLPGSVMRVQQLQGAAPPAGWSGKLWALEQGRAHLSTPLVLLLDADIELQPGTLSAVRSLLRSGQHALVSLMAMPPLGRGWERLLMPAFVYFFKLLYPFRLANARASRVAAAAGGCVLLRTAALDAIGGFGALRGALIDDCALAACVKAQGFSTWTGLTHSARTHRGYAGLAGIWAMVSRTAYTELRYSPARLLLCSVVMVLLFCVPVAVLVSGQGVRQALALLALAAMLASYWPVVRFYRLSGGWVLTLPLVAVLYLAMTWSSAWTYVRGTRAHWKGRAYARVAAGTEP